MIQFILDSVDILVVKESIPYVLNPRLYRPSILHAVPATIKNQNQPVSRNKTNKLKNHSMVRRLKFSTPSSTLCFLLLHTYMYPSLFHRKNLNRKIECHVRCMYWMNSDRRVGHVGRPYDTWQEDQVMFVDVHVDRSYAAPRTVPRGA